MYDSRTWLSVSRWKSITKCGERYRLERVEKHQSRPAAWIPRGVAAHSTIEEFEKSGRTIDPEQYFNEVAWPEALARTTLDYPNLDNWILTPRVRTVTQDLKLRQADGLKQVLRYVERALDEADLWRVVEVEYPFEIEFPGILFRGYIDMVREWHDGDLYLCDLKTGGDDDEDNRQLGAYGLGYQMTSGKSVPYGLYVYSKLDRSSTAIDLAPYTYDYVNQELQKLKKILDQGLLLANPSKSNCKFCGVAEFCKESKQ